MSVSDLLTLDDEFRIFYFLLSISSLKAEKSLTLKTKQSFKNIEH